MEQEATPLLNGDSAVSRENHGEPAEKSDQLSGPLFSLLLLLGVIEWSSPKDVPNNDEKERERVSLVGQSNVKRKLIFLISLSVQLFMTISSALSAMFYLYCYFGKMDHFLRFVAFLCYWPSLISAQLICIVALLKRRFNRASREDEITWVTVFSESSCASQFPSLPPSRVLRLPKIGVFVCLFIPFPVFIVTARMAMFFNLNDDCRNWLQCAWTAFESIHVCFFAAVCYFLYLKRVILEESCKKTADYIKKHAGEMDLCLNKVRRLFKDYIQLRRLLLPWLTFVLFNATFGITVVVTWNYHLIFPNGNQTTAMLTIETAEGKGDNPHSICPYSCDQISFLEDKHYVYIIYNMLVACRHLMTAVLSFFVVGGMDLKYIWDRFRIKIYYKFTAKNFLFWKSLKKFVDSLHPQTTVANLLSFFIPMVGFATALLSKNVDDF